MTYPAAVLADSPWGFWQLAETSGSTFADSSGNGRNLTISGSPTLGQVGPKGSAVQWGASTSQYAVTSVGTGNGSTNLSGTNGFTLECWVYLSVLPSDDVTLIGNGEGASSSANTEVGLTIRSSGAPRFYLFGTTMSQVFLDGSPLSTGTWHHIAAVATPSGMKLRVNKSTVATGPFGCLNNEYNRRIWVHGGGLNSTGQAVTLADPAVYANNALSDARIDAHYDDPPPSPVVIAGEAWAAPATMLDGAIPVNEPITLTGEAWSTSATMLDGSPGLRVTGEGWAAVADFLDGSIVGAPIVVAGEAWAAPATMLDGIGFTPPPLNGYGLILDSSATVSADAPLDPLPTPTGAPATTQRIVATSVPVPTLVAGRPQ